MPKSVLVQVVRLSISFEKEVHERVTDLADAHDVSTAWTIRKAANAYLEDHHHPVEPISRGQALLERHLSRYGLGA